MTDATPKKAGGPIQIDVPLEQGETHEQMLARMSLMPIGRHTLSAIGFAAGGFGQQDFTESLKVVAGVCGRVRAGNLDDLTDMLAAQAMACDTMFTEFSRRAAANAGTHLEAAQLYSNMALKAQANCRVTVEALAKVKRGGKQSIQITHVHQGGQAIVADTVNNRAPGGAEREKVEQVHEQAADAAVAALRSPDEGGNGVPLPSFEREDTLPAAWREVDRSAEG